MKKYARGACSSYTIPRNLDAIMNVPPVTHLSPCVARHLHRTLTPTSFPWSWERGCTNTCYMLRGLMEDSMTYAPFLIGVVETKVFKSCLRRQKGASDPAVKMNANLTGISNDLDFVRISKFASTWSSLAVVFTVASFVPFPAPYMLYKRFKLTRLLLFIC